MRGQSLVEFALVLPLLMLLLLGFGEMAILAATHQGYQNGADVLARSVAYHMASGKGESWNATWNKTSREELDRVGCFDAQIILPDETHQPGDRVMVRLSCRYEWRLTRVFGGLSVTVESEEVIPWPPSTPDPSPAPTAS